MKSHNLESNFSFQKSLAINSNLGFTKFNYYDTITERDQEKIYRQILFKKDAQEYRVGYNKKTIKITEYQNGQSVQTIKLKL
jgi:hypothetical protein